MSKSLKKADNLLSFSLAVVLLAFLGSLYFSNVLGYPPCDLCWYQRICIYPLLPLLITGLIRGEGRKAAIYSLPLVIIGFFIALYHNGIYYAAQLTNQSGLQPCSIGGTSCTSRYIEWFGFISIPLLSLLAFSAIGLSLLWYLHLTKSEA